MINISNDQKFDTKMQQASLGPNSGPISLDVKNELPKKLDKLDNDVMIKQETVTGIKIKQEIFDVQDTSEVSNPQYNSASVEIEKNFKNPCLTKENSKELDRDYQFYLPNSERQYLAMQHPAYRTAVGTGLSSNNNNITTNNNSNNYNTYGFSHFYQSPMFPSFSTNAHHDHQDMKSSVREKCVNNIIDKSNDLLNEDKFKMMQNKNYNNHGNHRHSRSNNISDFNDTLLRDYRSHHDFHQVKLPGYPVVSPATPTTSTTFRTSLEMTYFNQQQHQNIQQQQQQADQLNNLRRFYQGRQKKWSNSALKIRQPSVSFK